MIPLPLLPLPPLPPLPIDAFVDDIVRRVRAQRAVVVTAAPGAGKTTRVPPALTADGPVLLLQPRRVAARAIARRIADERGWTIGREVGWHVRFDRRFADDTRLIVATEGILTARVQRDPLLAGFRTIVIDEFHERSIHADLGIAFARQAWLARDDLGLVVMSATLDATRAAAFLNDCPIVDVPGRVHPIEIAYRPGVEIDRAVRDELPRATGAILCFLPGAPEIRRAADRLSDVVAGGMLVRPLHGGLDADEQDLAIAPSRQRRVILATNIAETTLTVPDVEIVIDSGLHKVARYDPDRGIDSLETERISRDSADQRAGRAGRVMAGSAVRLWDARDRLAPHREAEILRVDLASALLDVIAWGADPRSFEWYEVPPAGAVDAALDLLRSLGAIDGASRLTPLGRELGRVPVHPRLARVLVASEGAPAAALACVVIAERHYVPALGRATTSDVLSAIDDEARLPSHVRQIASELARMTRSIVGSDAATTAKTAKTANTIDESGLARAILCGYPDRVAKRRAPASDRFQLFSGTGARQGRESGVFDAEFVVALDVTRTGDAEAIIRMASAIERDWLAPTSIAIEHALDPASGEVRATEVERYGAIVLAERHGDVDPDVAADLVHQAYLSRERSAADAELVARLAAAGLDASEDAFAALVHSASRGRSRLRDVNPADALSGEMRRRLERDAPVDLILPSGRRTALRYRPDGRVVASAKLQELFGLGETPRVGLARVPVTFELLAPNGRPVQVTSDLKSFWHTGYQEVRKELRARYPRHPWPEDPWTATPTHRTVRRR